MYFDKVFYHLVYKIKYLYLKGDIVINDSLNSISEYEYDEIINLCINRYNEIKSDQQELFDSLYSNNIAKMYGLCNLDHNKFFDHKLNSILNNGYHYVNLFSVNNPDLFLGFISVFLNFRMFNDIADNKDESVLNNIVSIINDVNIFFYMAESLYYFNFISTKKYNEIVYKLNQFQVYFSYKNYEVLKNYIDTESSKFEEYIDSFNNMIEIVNIIDGNSYSVNYMLYNGDTVISEQKDFNDFLIAFDDDSKDAEKYKYKFISNGNILSEKDHKLSNFVSNYEEKLKYEEESKENREIFFNDNKKSAYKIAKYNIYRRRKFSSIDEKDADVIEEIFINILEYMYKVSYYREYLQINNIPLNSIYTDVINIDSLAENDDEYLNSYEYGIYDFG